MASWQYGWAVSAEAYGTTTSSTGPYTHTATYFPILPVSGGGTVVLKEAGTTIGTDDGNGNITGGTITGGTVNYVTGAMSFSFSSTPSSGQALTINYNASSINTTPTNLDDPVFNLKQVMKQAGWTVVASSDGTTYNSSGDQITVRGTGAGALGNNSAWFVIRDPSSTYWYLFRRSASTTGSWFIGVALSNYTYTSANATTTPTNALQWGLFGVTGLQTGSNPTTADWSLGSTTGNFHHEAAADSSAPYGVYAFGFTKNPASSVCLYAFLVDSLASGSYQTADAYLKVSYAAAVANGFGSAQTQSQGVAAINGVLSNYCAWTSWPVNFVGNPYTGKDDLLPVWYYFTVSATQQTYKGQSYYFKWETFTTASRGTGAILDQAALNDTVICNTFCFPWNLLPILLG